VPLDTLGRPLRSLRISVTDRCNLRCLYCMPEESYVWLPRQEILHYEEMARLADVFVSLGVEEIHITGGEPLVRHDLPRLVEMLAPRVKDLALTTNGTHLARMAGELRSAGLARVTVSLDTLRRERFLAMTRRDELAHVLEGIARAREAGFSPLKVNTVVMRGRNDDEIGDLLAFAKEAGAELRFIEYMDVGGATHWSWERVVSKREILERVEQRFGPPVPVITDPSSPAVRYRLADGTTFGVIASTTAPFCRACDRSRLTADGTFLLCLYATEGVNLRDALRSGASDDELRALVSSTWAARADRGAEVRLALREERGALATKDVLRKNPRLEMHTRGG
jgi:GTP 3',8-cyclase